MRTAVAKKKPPTPSDRLAELQHGAMERTFRLMDVAEEEIAVAKERHPKQAGAIQEAFKYLCPPPGMSAFVEDVFRAHARELIERVATGEGPKVLEHGTRAEALIALSQASLRAPLDATHGALFERLFAQILGDTSARVYREPYPGASDEALHQLLRHCGGPRR